MTLMMSDDAVQFTDTNMSHHDNHGTTKLLSLVLSFTRMQSYLECLPIAADIQVLLQVGQQGLTDDDIIGAGVVVKLLMPFLHHASL